MQIKDVNDNVTPWSEKTTLFRVMMVTYYVDNTTTLGAPRLVRQVNDFTPQALAGVVEDIDLTYDLVDGINNPAEIPSLPYTDYPESPGHLQLEPDPEGQHPRRRPIGADLAPDPGLHPESHFDFG